MFSALAKCLTIPEIRKKILFTLAMLAICRLVAYVPVPGIDPAALNAAVEAVRQKAGSSGGGNVVDMLNMFTGGALMRFSVGTLGIMPYITAAIIMQLVTPIYPQFEAWKREGESGFQKLNQTTRYLTLLICVVQGIFAAKLMMNPGALPGFNSAHPIVIMENAAVFQIMTVIIVTCGTLLLMWLGEQITEYGIGQGASLIITISIIESAPQAITTLVDLMRGGAGERTYTWVHLFILCALLVLVTAAVVAISTAVRRVPLQYARMMAGRPTGGAQTSFFPLPINYANVMPIIFASALMSFPPMLLPLGMQWFGWQWPAHIIPFFNWGSTSFLIIYAALIIVFTFFWVASQFNPVKMADELKRSNAYVPGIRPGKPTSDYLDWVMTRITTAGAFFLAIIALLPMIFQDGLKVPYQVAQFFGGASLLIIVGVLLTTVRQLESLLLHYGYDSFLQHGRSRRQKGRAPRAGLA